MKLDSLNVVEEEENEGEFKKLELMLNIFLYLNKIFIFYLIN